MLHARASPLRTRLARSAEADFHDYLTGEARDHIICISQSNAACRMLLALARELAPASCEVASAHDAHIVSNHRHQRIQLVIKLRGQFCLLLDVRLKALVHLGDGRFE